VSDPRRPKSSCSRVCCPADRLRSGALLNGKGAMLIGFGQRTDLLLFCCTAFVLLYCLSIVVLLYSCAAVVLL